MTKRKITYNTAADNIVVGFASTGGNLEKLLQETDKKIVKII